MSECSVWFPVFSGIFNIVSTLWNVTTPMLIGILALYPSHVKSFLHSYWRSFQKFYRFCVAPQVSEPVSHREILALLFLLLMQILMVANAFLTLFSSIVCPILGGAIWDTRFVIYASIIACICVLAGSFSIRQIHAILRVGNIPPARLG